MPMPFNVGDFKRFLAAEDRQDQYLPSGIKLPHLPAMDGTATVTPVRREAKTLLTKTLAEHDKVYHKNGYHEGDACNFREALMKGDSADEIEKAEKKESEAQLGLVKFVEEKNGEKKILGIEPIAEVSVGGPDKDDASN